MSDETSQGFMLHIEGREYDVTSLTLDEVEEIEDACGGVPLERLDLGLSKVLKAIAYALYKRDNPDADMEVIGKIRRLSLLETSAENGAVAVGDPD